MYAPHRLFIYSSIHYTIALDGSFEKKDAIARESLFVQDCSTLEISLRRLWWLIWGWCEAVSFCYSFQTRQYLEQLGPPNFHQTHSCRGHFTLKALHSLFLFSSNCSFRLTDLIPKRVWLPTTDRKVPFELSKKIGSQDLWMESDRKTHETSNLIIL